MSPPNGNGGTSQGSPNELHSSGVVFQRFANGIAGMAQTPVLQANGGSARASLRANDAALGASTTDFQTHLSDASNALLSFLIAAEPQFADAATDLFDSAGDFATADNQVPANAAVVGTTPDGIVVSSTDGLSGRDYYWKDREGHVYHEHLDGISSPAQLPPGLATPTQGPPSPSPGTAPQAPTPSAPTPPTAASSTPTPSATRS